MNHEEELRLAQFKAAFPGVGETAAFQQKERRAEWIRNNVTAIFITYQRSEESGNPYQEAIRDVEMLAEWLEDGGYL